MTHRHLVAGFMMVALMMLTPSLINAAEVADKRGAARPAPRVPTPAAFVGRAVRDAWAGTPVESSAAETLAFEIGPRSAAILVAKPAAGEEGGPDG